MAKKGKLSKVETFYIDSNYKILSIAQIAEDLDRTILSVEKYIKANLVSKTTSVMTAGEQMARREGIVTMTENASMVADSRKKKSTLSKKCVTRIKDDV